MRSRRPPRTRPIKPLTLITRGRISKTERHARLNENTTRLRKAGASIRPQVWTPTPFSSQNLSFSFCEERQLSVLVDVFGRRRARDKGMSISTFQDGQNCIGSLEHILPIGQITPPVKGGQGWSEVPLTEKTQDVSGTIPPGRSGQGKVGGYQIRNTGIHYPGESKGHLYNKRCSRLPLTAPTGGVERPAVLRLSGQGGLTPPLTTPDQPEVMSHV
ncbi:hypothetical protein Htur_5276 (plasmid) [Haloterrigena turkmenica DSM 5511]|uniref:Uncharacterized protein n=1 Tax=Haloterrigena turkmenica (strain ATCC 51198 / DSM 5511 / JCM 9101 / NCIMB 13204 / VKM B-1734 / 4k) TaxID=543526 RepID=D2S3Q7_HALTV|nr:hypothetical protein Htur_5276 [Haloterrigena turkmenica DSM 5511]